VLVLVRGQRHALEGGRRGVRREAEAGCGHWGAGDAVGVAVQHCGGAAGSGRREELLGDGLCGGLDVVLAGLGGEHALGLVAVTLAFAVFFVGVLDRDFFVHEVLAVHVGNGFVGGFEVGEGYEAVAFGEVGIIAGDLGLRFSSVRGFGARRGGGDATFGADIRLPNRLNVS